MLLLLAASRLVFGWKQLRFLDGVEGEGRGCLKSSLDVWWIPERPSSGSLVALAPFRPSYFPYEEEG